MPFMKSFRAFSDILADFRDEVGKNVVEF